MKRLNLRSLGNSYGLRAGQLVAVEKSPFTFGRLNDRDVILVDPRLGVSRRHCQIVLTDDDATIEDQQSHNGTYVNSTKITGPTTLKPGDIIGICNAAFEVLPEDPTGDSLPALSVSGDQSISGDQTFSGSLRSIADDFRKNNE